MAIRLADPDAFGDFGDLGLAPPPPETLACPSLRQGKVPAERRGDLPATYGMADIAREVCSCFSELVWVGLE